MKKTTPAYSPIESYERKNRKKFKTKNCFRCCLVACSPSKRWTDCRATTLIKMQLDALDVRRWNGFERERERARERRSRGKRCPSEDSKDFERDESHIPAATLLLTHISGDVWPESLVSISLQRSFIAISFPDRV